MLKVIVCKTVVPRPEETQFLLVGNDGASLSAYTTIGALAGEVRSCRERHEYGSYIKNETPGDIVYLKNIPTILAKLTVRELRDLARKLNR